MQPKELCGCQDRIKISIKLVRKITYLINAPTKKDERIANVDNMHVKRDVSELLWKPVSLERLDMNSCYLKRLI